VGKTRFGARDVLSGSGERLQACVERERAQGHDRRAARKKSQLPLEVAAAVVELAGKRAVPGRRAPHRGRDQRPGEDQSVAQPPRLGLIGEARLVERAKEKIAGLVSGEDAPRAVAAMGGRSETDDQDARPCVSEGGKRPGPVPLPAKPSGRVLRRELPPGHQSGTAAAGDDFALELAETVGRTGRAPVSSESTCP